MARLSRTEKYAGLREELSSSNEQNNVSSQLSEYEDKLKQLQELQRQVEAAKAQMQNIAATPTYQEVKSEPVAAPVFEEVKIEPVKAPVFEEIKVEPVITPMEEPKMEIPNFDEIKVEDDDFMKPFTEIQVEEIPEVKPQVVDDVQKEEPVQEVTATFEEIVNTMDQNTNKDIPTLKDDVQKPIAEFVEDNKENILKDTLQEVRNYNEKDGNQTIEQITNNLVDEVRHPDEDQTIQENDFVIEEQADEEFSNTVTMEINKIMDQMSTTQTSKIDLSSVIQEEKQQEQSKQEEIKPASKYVSTYFDLKQEEVKKSSFDIPFEEEEKQEDGLEIKNISELEKTHDEISDTIPFVVSDEEDEEDDEYEEDDDDDASNTVLNVILIVLIVILVAVLGLIVFYILKTKGIIG